MASANLRRQGLLFLAMMALPVIGAAAYEVSSARHPKTPSVAPSQTLSSVVARTAKSAEQAPTTRTTRPELTTPAPRAHGNRDYAAPRAERPGRSSDSTTPTSNPLDVWNEERHGLTSGIAHERVISEMFREEGAGDALREVECRQTLCKITLDKSIFAEMEQARTAAVKFANDFTLLQDDSDAIVALIPAENVDRIAQSEERERRILTLPAQHLASRRTPSTLSRCAESASLP